MGVVTEHRQDIFYVKLDHSSGRSMIVLMQDTDFYRIFGRKHKKLLKVVFPELFKGIVKPIFKYKETEGYVGFLEINQLFPDSIIRDIAVFAVDLGDSSPNFEEYPILLGVQGFGVQWIEYISWDELRKLRGFSSWFWLGSGVFLEPIFYSINMLIKN